MKTIVIACAFAAVAVLALPNTSEAQSFYIQSYPNNGWAFGGCQSGWCGAAYQYSPNTYGFTYQTYAPRTQYVYQQPTYARTPYIPYYVIQQTTPSYYRQPDPYAYNRDFIQAQQKVYYDIASYPMLYY